MKRATHYFPHRGHARQRSTWFLHISRLLLPVALVLLLGIFLGGVFLSPDTLGNQLYLLGSALALSLVRLFGAFVCALVIGISLGVFAEKSRFLESLLLPIFDVFESLPVLAFFPVLILFFLHSGWIEGASLFIIFFSMVWNIAFSTVGGLKVIPHDIIAVGKVFGLSPTQRFRKVTLPALFPPLVTGSILSLADGWNVLIVAEALHAYAPINSGVVDLLGIGSLLITASSSGQSSLIISAIALLVVVIAFINLVIWQPLLAKAERFKFE